MNKRRTVLSSVLGALLAASLPGMASASGGISFGLNVGPASYYALPQNYYYRPPTVEYGYPAYPQARVYSRGYYYASPGYGYDHDDEDYSRHEWREHQGWRQHHDRDDDD